MLTFALVIKKKMAAGRPRTLGGVSNGGGRGGRSGAKVGGIEGWLTYYLSQKMVVQNHADLVAFCAILIVAGTMFKVRSFRKTFNNYRDFYVEKSVKMCKVGYREVKMKRMQMSLL